MIGMKYFQNIECMKIKIEIGKQLNDERFDRKWRMGSCFGPKPFPDRFHGPINRYEAGKSYLDVCCLNDGNHILECANSIEPNGWGNGYIEISGQRYCDDFIGFRSFRNVKVKSKLLQ